MCSWYTQERMGALHLLLALFLLLSSSVRAQWWSLLWANPKTSTNSSPSITPPSITSLGPSETPGTTEWLVTEDSESEIALDHSTQTDRSVLIPTPSPGVPIFGQSTTEPGILPPEKRTGGWSKARAQYKPLKHWKRGECYRDVEWVGH